MKIFAEISLQNYLEQTLSLIIKSIEKESAQTINNKDEYLKEKIQTAHIDPVILQADKLSITLSEQMIPAEQFPALFSVQEGKSYKKEVIKFHIPYTGDKRLFACHPKDQIDWTMEIELNDDEFCFEIINISNNTNAINNDKESNLKNITKRFDDIASIVSKYNASIGTKIQQSFDAK